jgi:uncharacterized protein (UPF0276 family)
MTMNAANAGIGFKAQHCADVLATLPRLAFVEIHAENYMGAGGPPHRQLSAIRHHYELSIHGVGLSLGGAEALDEDHLSALAKVVETYRPKLVSEHLAWGSIDGAYLNDLLPLPYTARSLGLVCDHVDQLQERLGRQVLIENPAAYVSFTSTTMDEAEFLAALAARTGCGILFDANNLFVSSQNLGLDATAYLEALPAEAIGEFHLAGHHIRRLGNAEIRIDDHGSRVCDEVWLLYRQAVARFGRRPTLIEWDSAVPPLAELLDEARRADAEADRAIESEALA